MNPVEVTKRDEPNVETHWVFVFSPSTLQFCAGEKTKILNRMAIWVRLLDLRPTKDHESNPKLTLRLKITEIRTAIWVRLLDFKHRSLILKTE